jgi:hypothetical protein
MKITPLKDYPPITKAFLDSLKEQFPKKEYTYETPVREIDYLQGVQSVIMFLEKLYSFQTTPRK